LPDVDPSCPELLQPCNLSCLIDPARGDVDVHAVLHALRLGDFDEYQLNVSLAWVPGCGHPHPLSLSLRFPPESRCPELRSALHVVAVNVDLDESRSHEGAFNHTGAAPKREHPRRRSGQRETGQQRIQQAADLLALPVGDFVRSAAEMRAEQVIRNTASTLVPIDFFEALLRALDQPARPNAALKRAARRGRTVVQPR